MNALRNFILIFAALTMASSIGRGQALVPGDVTYTFNVDDPASSLTDGIFFYNGSDSSSVEGGLPDFSPGVTMADVGNPFSKTAVSFGALGVDDLTFVNSPVTPVVDVGFSDDGTAEVGQTFDSIFGGFFAQHTDLTDSQDTIVQALGDPNFLDNDTADESGRVIYQFRDYVQGLSDTAATIDTGDLTLVEFGGDSGTILGDATASQSVAVVPEPGTWAILLLGLAVIGLAPRRLRAR